VTDVPVIAATQPMGGVSQAQAQQPSFQVTQSAQHFHRPLRRLWPATYTRPIDSCHSLLFSSCVRVYRLPDR
jgi:hypothetical protein